MSDQTNAAIVSTVTTNHQTIIYFQSVIFNLGYLMTNYLINPPHQPFSVITSVHLDQIIFNVNNCLFS